MPTKRRSADAQPQVAPLSRSRLTRSRVSRVRHRGTGAPTNQSPSPQYGAAWEERGGTCDSLPGAALAAKSTHASPGRGPSADVTRAPRFARRSSRREHFSSAPALGLAGAEGGDLAGSARSAADQDRPVRPAGTGGARLSRAQQPLQAGSCRSGSSVLGPQGAQSGNSPNIGNRLARVIRGMGREQRGPPRPVVDRRLRRPAASLLTPAGRPGQCNFASSNDCSRSPQSAQVDPLPSYTTAIGRHKADVNAWPGCGLDPTFSAARWSQGRLRRPSDTATVRTAAGCMCAATEI